MTKKRVPLPFRPLRTAIAALLWVNVAGAQDPTPAAPAPSQPTPAPLHIPVPSEAELNQHPLAAGEYLLELSDKADQAERSQDFESALKYYEAIAKMVPDRATAFAKICRLNQALGKRERALIACRQATGLEAVKLEDYVRYLTLLISTAEGQSMMPAEVVEADLVLSHLANAQLAGPEAEVLACQLGLKLREVERVRGCLEKLEKKTTEPGLILPYQFSLALLEKDIARARGVVEKARLAALPPSAIEMMEAELDEQQGNGSSRTWLVLGAMLVAAGASAIVWLRRRRAMLAGRTAAGADGRPVAQAHQ